MKDHRMAGPSDGERSAESRRILDRVAREADSSGLDLLGRTTERARNHIAAADADQKDWAELWGTRIGRTIGAIALVALVIWALSLLASGA
jgi:hypothetical protein